MIDLFGLSSHQDPQKPEQGAVPAPDIAADAPAPQGSHTLWAFLLVLDSVCVIVFAGAVAAKVYQHWKAPVLSPAPRRRPAAPPAPAAVPVAAVLVAPAPVPVMALQPPKPADDRAIGRGSVPPTSRQEATAPRPPKPSMLAEAPKHRGTPKPADAGGKSPVAAKPAVPAPASPAPGAGEVKVKALRTEFKVLAAKAQAVELVGAFIVHGGRKDMARQDDGTWTVTLYLNPGSYRYFFSVDKKKQLDPENSRSEKGASLLTLP